MIGVSVVLDYDGNFDRSGVVEVAKIRGRCWRGCRVFTSRSSPSTRSSSVRSTSTYGIRRRRRKIFSPTNFERG